MDEPREDVGRVWQIWWQDVGREWVLEGDSNIVRYIAHLRCYARRSSNSIRMRRICSAEMSAGSNLE